MLWFSIILGLKLLKCTLYCDSLGEISDTDHLHFAECSSASFGTQGVNSKKVMDLPWSESSSQPTHEAAYARTAGSHLRDFGFRAAHSAWPSKPRAVRPMRCT